MVLVLQIAAGIVLGFFVLANWAGLLSLALRLAIASVAIGAVCLVWLAVAPHENFFEWILVLLLIGVGALTFYVLARVLGWVVMDILKPKPKLPTPTAD